MVSSFRKSCCLGSSCSLATCSVERRIFCYSEFMNHVKMDFDFPVLPVHKQIKKQMCS